MNWHFYHYITTFFISYDSFLLEVYFAWYNYPCSLLVTFCMEYLFPYCHFQPIYILTYVVLYRVASAVKTLHQSAWPEILGGPTDRVHRFCVLICGVGLVARLTGTGLIQGSNGVGLSTEFIGEVSGTSVWRGHVDTKGHWGGPGTWDLKGRTRAGFLNTILGFILNCHHILCCV
jgi:hypothetical protein